MSDQFDDSDEAYRPHKPQFPSAPGQARKTATVEDSLEAAAELKHMKNDARQKARERREALSRYGKGALPPEEW
ncbi:MAG TPA: hypothetical protein VJ985_08725 [Gammaproteobacteria bacterium]|nr:hypothetical protein [Gammaproteobacteria bacterium]